GPPRTTTRRASTPPCGTAGSNWERSTPSPRSNRSSRDSGSPSPTTPPDRHGATLDRSGLPDPAGHKYRPGRARRGSSPHTAVRVAPPSEHTARPARRHHLEEHVWRYIGRKSFVYVLTFVV